MAKIVKTLTVSWQWSGDKYSLRGFNLAVTPAAKNPKEEVVAAAFVETKEIKQTYSYKMGNVTLDKDAQYKIWVQAVYENSDSDWVATGGATVSDDGSATIITKTDREIQDVVNMASDNILTRQEKISLRREWQEIVYEFLEIESTAISQGIPSSNTAFSNFKSKGNALGTYLNGGTTWTISSNNKTSFPLWINDSNLGSNTSINGNTYRETFRVYYEAKVKILEEINKYKVNNVQVGGVNLLVGTATAKNTNVNAPTSFITWDPYTTHNKQTLEQLGFKAGDKVTIGFDWSISKNGTNDYVYGNFRVEFRGIKSDGTDNQYLGVIKNPAGTFSSSNTKGRVEATVALDSTTIKAHSLRFRIDNSVLNFKVSNLKMERGTKATGWSPALEEMENAYTIILTNEAQVIPTNSNRVPTSSTTYFTDIQVYKGTLQRNDYTIGTVNSANGITVSKTSSRVNFAVSTNTALAADGGNFVIPITIDGKTFNKTFSWSCSKQGNTGDSGVGISKITEYYAVSSSNTTEPTSWSTTVPAMTATNKYLWNYETITYSNNTTANTSKRVIGVYGDKGNTGDTGATGNGVSKIVNYYLATSSSSGVTTSTSGWTTSVQAVSASKKYLWNYEVVTYTNGSTSTTTPCIIGTYGDKGDKGDKGDSAKNVTLTATSQVFKSTDGGKNFTPDSITIKAAYQNVSHSKWQHSLDGGKTWVDTGTNTNGVTIDGNGFTISKTSTLFTDKVTSIVVKDVTNNSSVYDTITITKLYDVTDIEIGATNLVKNSAMLQSWTQFQEYRGTKTVVNDTTARCGKHVKFECTTAGTGFYMNIWNGDDSCIGKKYTWSFYAKTNKNMTLANVGHERGGRTSIATTTEWKKFTHTWTYSSSGNRAFTFYCNFAVGDILYIKDFQIEEGTIATDWSPCPSDLENAYSVILTNEAQVIPTNNSRVPTSSTTYYTDIQVYQGTTQRTDYTIGTINSANGITVSKTSSRVNFAVSTSTALTADGGNFTIPITIDGKTFNKTFSWSCSKQGNTGNDAYTVILTNESHTFPTKNDGSISSAISTTTQVLAYKGASSVTPDIGTLPAVDGLTLSKNKTTITIQANTGTSLADSGSFNIPVTVDGKSFTKTFSWSKSKKGDTGSKGDGAKSADIIASSQVFKSTDGGLTFSPATIKLTPKLQNVSYSNWQYSTNGGSNWNGFSNSISGWSVSGGVLTINKDCSLFTTAVTSVVFRLNTNDSSVYDTMTIVKLYDVADLEIGGRNYIRNGKGDKKAGFFKNFNNVTGGYGELTLTSQKTYSNISIADGFVLGCRDYEVGRKMVFSYDIMYTKWDFPSGADRKEFWVGQRYTNTSDGSEANGKWRSVTSHNLPIVGEKGCKLNEWYHVSKVITIPEQADASVHTEAAIKFYNSNANVSASFTARFKNVKLEYGNMETDWTPAPEEVNSNIDDVKNSLNSFQNTVNTSFKDGIIEQAEAKAIAQHLKTLDAEKADIDKEYSTIYSNANLTGSAKTNLASAKTSFDSAHTSLKSTINTVISDGRVTSSESSSVTSTFNTYNTQLGVYKQRVQEALDNISSGKVDNVQVGGRNLARKGSVVKYNSNASATTVNDANFLTDGSATISRTAVVNEGAMIDRYVVYDGGANYVAAFKMRTTSGTVNSIHFYNGRGHRNSKVYIDGVYKGTMGQDLTFPNDTNYHKIEVRFEAVATDSATANAQNTQHIIPQPMKGTASAYTIQILNLKIEKGNKATDWTPAPEDVKNHAEQSAQNAVDAQTQNSIFNKLTNNGQTQGIYLENSKIYINGEYIKANTLSADKVLVGDYTNYCQLTEQTPMSDKFNKYTHSDSTIWHEMKTINRDTRISRDYSCKGGEKFRVTGYVYGKVTSTTSGAGSTTQENTRFRVAIFGKKTDGSNFWLYGDNGDGASTGSIVQVNKIITLPSNAKSFYVALQIEGYAPFSGVARCRNIEVRRMSTGELIVDGSITAKSLHADVLSANSIVSTINGGSTNISGSKIRTGTIQSNNGKSTINLDNGSMNLGATSDASYLQWTGSALNIKANSVSIGATSVATTTDVTNGINKIDIGGKNLAKQTKLLTDVVLNGWTVTNTGNKGFKKLEIVTDNTSWQECNIPLYTEINTITKSVTVSFEYQETSSGLLMFSFGSYNGNTRVSEVSNVAVSSSFKVISTNGNWKTVSYTFDPTSVNNKDGITQYKIQFKKASGKTGTIYVRKPKLELGNKATDWSPAPEDTETDITNALKPLVEADNLLTKRLDNAFSDGVITPYEKIQLAADLKEIDAQYDDMTKTVKSYNDSSITGIYNEYKTAYNNLHTKLDSCLANMDVETKTSRSVVKDAIALYGTRYSHLRSAIDNYIKDNFDITTSTISTLSNSVEIAISKSSSNEQNLNTISKHMKFSNEGWLELFATTNGNEGRFKTKITDSKLSFTDNNQEVAYMSNQKLFINHAQINNELQIGSIVTTKSDKGGIIFKWQ